MGCCVGCPFESSAKTSTSRFISRHANRTGTVAEFIKYNCAIFIPKLAKLREEKRGETLKNLGF